MSTGAVRGRWKSQLVLLDVSKFIVEEGVFNIGTHFFCFNNQVILASMDIFTRKVERVLPEGDILQKKIKAGEKLNVYMGIDPTATRIHLGHVVGLRKLQEFVELGHNVTFLIGDFTALIGDTSDKDGERPVLTHEEIQENFKTYKEQASKILDFSRVKVVHNSEWLKDLTFKDLVSLCQHFSVGDFVSRELIKNRLSSGKRVGLHETLYPVMQGYDSYILKTDLQIGGSDQTFNMLAGRTLIKDIDGRESFVMVTSYLTGTDGRKMSKSWGNAIWLQDAPHEMYGKVMSLRDELIPEYLRLATNMEESEINAALLKLEKGENPMVVKQLLAHRVVTELHSSELADEAAEGFKKAFQENKPEFETLMLDSENANLTGVFSKLNVSISEGKRLVKSGAVEINGQTQRELKTDLKTGDTLRIGKKTFIKIEVS